MNKQLMNFIIALKNASQAGIETVDYRSSNAIVNLVRALYREGFIQSYNLYKIKNISYINVILRFYFNMPIIGKIRIISNSSNFKTLTYSELACIQIRRRVLFISTDRGILTLDECKKAKIGGVLLFLC